MSAAAGVAAHICDCAVEQCVELFLFFFCEALNHLCFRIGDGTADALGEGLSLGHQVDPLASTVCFVRAELNEVLLFKPGEQAGNRGVGQIERILDIPGAGRTFPVGNITEDRSLGGCQVKVHQGLGHPLIGTPVKDSDIMAEMFFQNGHLHDKM